MLHILKAMIHIVDDTIVALLTNEYKNMDLIQGRIQGAGRRPPPLGTQLFTFLPSMAVRFFTSSAAPLPEKPSIRS